MPDEIVEERYPSVRAQRLNATHYALQEADWQEQLRAIVVARPISFIGRELTQDDTPQ